MGIREKYQKFKYGFNDKEIINFNMTYLSWLSSVIKAQEKRMRNKQLYTDLYVMREKIDSIILHKNGALVYNLNSVYDINLFLHWAERICKRCEKREILQYKRQGIKQEYLSELYLEFSYYYIFKKFNDVFLKYSDTVFLRHMYEWLWVRLKRYSELIPDVYSYPYNKSPHKIEVDKMVNILSKMKSNDCSEIDIFFEWFKNNLRFLFLNDIKTKKEDCLEIIILKTIQNNIGKEIKKKQPSIHALIDVLLTTDTTDSLSTHIEQDEFIKWYDSGAFKEEELLYPQNRSETLYHTLMLNMAYRSFVFDKINIWWRTDTNLYCTEDIRKINNILKKLLYNTEENVYGKKMLEKFII